MTQEELAERCGIALNRLSRIERNLASPRVPEISTLCDTLDISADWWLRETHSPHARLHQEIDTLSKSQATVLCVMFDFILHDRHEQAHNSASHPARRTSDKTETPGTKKGPKPL